MNTDLKLMRRVVWSVCQNLKKRGITTNKIEFTSPPQFYAKRGNIKQEDLDYFNKALGTTDKLINRLRERGLIVYNAKILNSSAVFSCMCQYREDIFQQTVGFGVGNVIISDTIEFQVKARYGKP